MTIKPLDLLFVPKSLALVGASPKEKSMGKAILENLIKGGYEGQIFPVNPKYTEAFGIPFFSTIDELPIPPDLAVICTPPTIIPSLIESLGKKGTKAAIVISAGFKEGGREEGTLLQDKMIEMAQTYGVRIVGPNCLGMMNPHAKLNATFSSLMPPKGKVAFISQSGAIIVSLLEWATTMGIGFSKLVSVGGLSDLNFTDYLTYLEEDPHTEAIILYIEALTDAKAFLAAAKKIVMKKPVAVMKSGRFQGTAQAVRSHSGSLAGSDAVYEAAFRQAGLCRLYELQDVYDLLLTLNHLPKLKGNGLTILTNGGGVGILATDAVIATGGNLTPLSEETLSKLNAVLPPTWSLGNPVDIIGDAPPERYAATLEILMDDPSVETILLMHCPLVLSPAKEVFDTVIETIDKKSSKRPDIFMVSLQQNLEKNTLLNFNHYKIPIYPTPERAVRSFMHLLKCENEKHFIDRSIEETVPFNPKVVQIFKGLIEKKEQEWLDHHVIQEVLTAYGIPIVRTEVAASPVEAKTISQKMDFPLVLKIASKDIVHKSDVGGVVLNLSSPEEVEEKAQAMLDKIAAHQPNARIEGFILQPMIPQDHGFELFLGGIQDATFGPVVIFGAGGKSVEVVNDKALALAPLTQKSALDLIQQTRIYEQLKGYRDQPPVPLEQLITCLIHLSYLLVNHPEISELDINPLLTDPKRLLVLDSRMRLTLHPSEEHSV